MVFLRMGSCLFCVLCLMASRRYSSTWPAYALVMYWAYFIMLFLLSMKYYRYIARRKWVFTTILVYTSFPFFGVLYEIIRSRHVPNSAMDFIILCIPLSLPVIKWCEYRGRRQPMNFRI